VHFLAQAMAHQLSNYAVPMALGVFLYGKADVANPVSGYHLLNTKIQALFWSHPAAAGFLDQSRPTAKV
jgi:hypothetical protein